MSTKINQKEYLKKYLGGPSKEKKKKKRKPIKTQGLQIIDDDIDLTKLRPLDGDELDVFGEGEDAPQVAGIIDERPEDIKKMEQYNSSSKWRVINQDDGFNSKLQIEEIKKDRKQQEKENEIVFGKMYSDSEDEKKSDSDASPPRKGAQQVSKNNQDNRKSNKNYDSDVSPPRKPESKPKERRKPSRWADNDADSNPSSQRNSRRSKSPRMYIRNDDSDESPSRRSKRDEKRGRSPKRKDKKADNASPSRKSKKDRRHSSDSDISPPRKSKKDSKRHKSPDSDSPPPSKSAKHKNNSQKDSKRRKSPDSDLSPPRKRKTSPVRQRNDDSDSDLSPPRKSNSKRQNSPDSDASPPRKNRRNSDSPPPTNKKMARTLEGKLAGLQDALQLKKENEAFRRREEEAFSKMTDEVSGRNAAVNKRSVKRETSEDRQKLKEKSERQKELDEKYKKWSKGVKQVEAIEARHRDFLHEAAKPLARFQGDKDLEASLKQVDREGDPMANYMREKRRGGLPEKPSYKGSFPPNRFNIRPGYRWDGVDRSNGYEKKYFETQSKKRAEEEDYYKWSSADM